MSQQPSIVLSHICTFNLDPSRTLYTAALGFEVDRCSNGRRRVKS